VDRDYSGYGSLPKEHDCAAFKYLMTRIGIKPTAEPKKPINSLLPFGALNRTTLMKAKEILSLLGHCIKENKEHLRSHDKTPKEVDLASHYFSLVPRQLNKSGFPSLTTELIHTAEEAKIDSWLANYPEEMWKHLGPPHHICNGWAQLQNELGLEEVESLAKTTTEYAHISNYFLQSQKRKKEYHPHAA